MFRKPLVSLIVASVILFFTAVNSQAQNGLGDPVMNFTFGAGSSVHGPEVPGINNYTFTNADVPPIGSYTVLNNTNVAPAIWWPTTDHTIGDGNNGYMMIARTRTNGFEVLFEYRANGLCAGTSYEFGAYLLNLTRTPGGTPPELILRVVEAPTATTTGATILEIPYGPVTQLSQNPTDADWVHPTMNFTCPAGVGSVKVFIISKTPGGTGMDDLAIDDITVNAMGQRIDAAFDSGNPTYQEVCADTPQPFSATATTPTAGNDIKWQRKLNDGLWADIPGATSTNLSFTSETVAGMYRYRAASAPPDKLGSFSCSVVTNELTVWVKPVVIVNANANPDGNKLYLRGLAPIQLLGSTNSTDFHWEVEPGGDISSLSSTTVLNPLASPNVTTTYILRSNPDANTCGISRESRVTVLVADDLIIANTFTPNADGINDTWFIRGLNTYPDAITQIYNRNGQLIFKSIGGSASPWDGTYKGKNVPAGSYYYIVDLNLNNLKVSGSVTVIR
nr:gliding motility-associated C-terminal domain-containing protein [uncultured Mucilaginibacter sp.]